MRTGGGYARNDSSRSKSDCRISLSSGETAVVNDGVPQGIEIANHSNRIRSKKDTSTRRHAELRLRVISYRERV